MKLKALPVLLFALIFLSTNTAIADDLNFSKSRGFYNAPITVNLSSDLPNAQIKYTVNGLRPSTTTGTTYSGSAINVNSTTYIQAIAFNNTDTSKVICNSYFYLNDIAADPSLNSWIMQDPTWGAEFELALTSIPTVSLVSDSIINPDNKVSASAEFIFPSTGNHFQINCGAENFGNASINFVKRNMRLHFDSEFGPKNLKYPIFEGFESGISPEDKFDKLDLRSSHDSWLWNPSFHGWRAESYITTKLMDDIMLKGGSVNPHNRHVHVYLNGSYWGLFDLREKFDDNFLAEYLGGDNNDYDFISGSKVTVSVFQPEFGVLKDGTGVQYQNLVNASNNYNLWKTMVNENSLFDLMTQFMYGFAEAEWNAAGAPDFGKEFHFQVNDADLFYTRGIVERTNRTDPRHNANGPDNMFLNLFTENHPDFIQDFSDRAALMLTNGGSLTQQTLDNHYQDLSLMIDKAIIGEAAKWADDPTENPQQWRDQIDSMAITFTPFRTQVVIDQMKETGIYPNLDPVAYSLPAGIVPINANVSIANPNAQGDIYYTLDGTDPRAAGGAINSTASQYTNPITIGNFSTLINSRVRGQETTYPKTNLAVNKPISSSGTYSVFTENFANDGNILGTYADQQVTYISSKPQTWLEIDLQSNQQIDEVVVWNRSEAGYVLNFKDPYVFISDVPFTSNLVADLLADPNVDSYQINGYGADKMLFETNSVGRYVRLQVDQSYYIMVSEMEILQKDLTNPQTETIWSPMVPQLYFTPQNYNDLVINEIHYHPTDSIFPNDTIDGDEYEFIELKNNGSTNIDLTRVKFDKGISYTFPYNKVIPPGSFIVLAEDAAHFLERYGFNADGVFKGKLSNGGEHLRLTDPFGNLIDELIYDDAAPWTNVPDGSGHSLALLPTFTNNDNAVDWSSQVTRYTPRVQNNFCVPMSATSYKIDVDCNGANNGSIVFIPNGGTSPLNFSWSNGATTQNLSNLNGGSYTVNVTDYFGCNYNEVFNIIEPAVLNINSTATDLLCGGDNNGSVQTATMGGTAPYNYSWQHGPTSQNINNLAGGTYTVNVTDSKGCSESLTTTVNEPTSLTLSAFHVNESIAGANDGVINLAVSGGTAPFTYNWSHGPNYQDVNSLAPGNYSVVVTDANNCSETYSVTITSGSAPCTMPSNIAASNIQNTSATLSWDVDPNANSFSVEYKEQGAANWNVFSSNFSFAILNNLVACKNYEVRIKANCPSAQTSGYSNIYTFQTNGCIAPCATINGLFSQNITTSSAFLVWDIVPNATYTMYYRAVGNATWFTYPTQFPIAILFTLPSCTDFEWYVEVNCTNGQISNASPIANFTTVGAACKNSPSIDPTADLNNNISNWIAYPNPTTNLVSIQANSNHTEKINVSLYTVQGQLIQSKTDIYIQEATFDLSNLNTGSFIIQVQTDDSIFSLPVIKN